MSEILDLSGPEMDLVEREAGTGVSGNSGAAQAKVELWNELAKSLEVAFQAQFNQIALGDKVRPVDISKLCDAFDNQQGALKNKVKGFQVRITFVRNKPKVSIRWTQLAEQDRAAAKADSIAFVKEVNAQKGDLLIGGLNLTRSFVWEGKRYVIADSLRDVEYDRKDEVTARYYFLNVGKFWHSGGRNKGNKKLVSK